MTIQEIEQLQNIELLKIVYDKCSGFLDKDLIGIYNIGTPNIIMDIIFRILKVDDLHVYWSAGGWEVWLNETYTAYHPIQNVALLRAILMMIMDGEGKLK